MKIFKDPIREQRNLWDDPLSTLAWYDFMMFVMMLPSTSVIVFLRTKLGYRLMKPWVMGMIFWGLMVSSVLFSPQALTINPDAIVTATARNMRNNYRQQHPGEVLPMGEPREIPQHQSSGPAPLAYFAIAMVLLAWFHRRRAWKLVFHPDNPLHTMARGDSYIYMVTSRFLPFISEYHVQRYIEPVICMLLGLVFTAFPSYYLLGAWLVFSGVALAGIEQVVEQQRIKVLLDDADGTIEARALAEAAKVMAATHAPKSGKIAKIGGVTVSPEVMRLRAKLAQQAPSKPTHAVVAAPEARNGSQALPQPDDTADTTTIS